MLQRTLDQPGRQGGEVEGQREAKPQIHLNLLEMGSAGVAAGTVCRNSGGGHLSLLRHKGDRFAWGQAHVIGRKPQIPQRTELEGKA